MVTDADRNKQFMRAAQLGPGRLRRVISHVTSPALAHTSAPTVIVHGTPTACERRPDSSPPTNNARKSMT
jgi:hypothetical protein